MLPLFILFSHSLYFRVLSPPTVRKASLLQVSAKVCHVDLGGNWRNDFNGIPTNTLDVSCFNLLLMYVKSHISIVALLTMCLNVASHQIFAQNTTAEDNKPLPDISEVVSLGKCSNFPKSPCNNT